MHAICGRLLVLICSEVMHFAAPRPFHSVLLVSIEHQAGRSGPGGQVGCTQWPNPAVVWWESC